MCAKLYKHVDGRGDVHGFRRITLRAITMERLWGSTKELMFAKSGRWQVGWHVTASMRGFLLDWEGISGTSGSCTTSASRGTCLS